ncbi:MAG: methyl coenzyme M reductase-arginine methyltransferase Mmp10 [Methanospirillum sp.]|nr:methyl coenzyme M reductase-arginine methyltransferase Mmp10 [Methanospirillum sp.]
MGQLIVDIGGRPGLDCRGFCSYCYFRHVRDPAPLGCRHCLPFRKGCDYCTRMVREAYPGFRPFREVAEETLGRLQLASDEIDRVTISGGGDPSCYPAFDDLVEVLAAIESPLHIGYTSGKGFDDPEVAGRLVENGLTEVSFTVFASDPGLRKRYMHDPTPEASLAVVEELAGAIDLYAAAVILPGVNDGAVLEATADWLEEAGARGLILMRFANEVRQGLVLGNAPVIPGVEPQDVESFSALVRETAQGRSMRVTGTPLLDPALGSPFAIRDEPDLLDRLPRVTGRASVVTGSVAAPFLGGLLERLGETAQVAPVKKEIACLITADDLRDLDLSTLENVVVIPGRALVHDAEAEAILSSDGRRRTVVRGPDMLTADGETSMGMTREGVLDLEMRGLFELVNTINLHGGR